MITPQDLSRTGTCTACGYLVIQHFHPFTNVMRGCAYALRINNDFSRANETPAPAVQTDVDETARAGEQLLREGRF